MARNSGQFRVSVLMKFVFTLLTLFSLAIGKASGFEVADFYDHRYDISPDGTIVVGAYNLGGSVLQNQQLVIFD